MTKSSAPGLDSLRKAEDMAEMRYPRRKRIWNQLRWSRVGRWLRGL